MEISKMKLEKSSKETSWTFWYPNDLNKAIGLFVLAFEDEEGNQQNQRKFVTAKEYDIKSI